MSDLATHFWILDNDSTFLGWTIFIAYLVTSWCCLKKGRKLNDSQVSMMFWYGLAFLMLFLGINKQLDLQTMLASLARQAAITDGWYDYRKQMQYVFVMVLALLLTFLLVFSRLLLAEAWHKFKLAWIGIFVLFAFIVLRAAAFNHQARALLESVNSYYQLLELVGVMVILIASQLNYPKENKSILF